VKRNRRSITCTGSDVLAVMLLLIAMPTKGRLACFVADRQRWSVQRLRPWSLLNVATSGPLTRCCETGRIDTRCDSVSPTVVVHSVLIISPYYRSRHPELRSPPILHMHSLSYYANACMKVHIAVNNFNAGGPGRSTISVCFS
jgi:hypothetical protein